MLDENRARCPLRVRQMTFSESTPSPCAAPATLPNASATPMNDAAGIVVTEIATPTAALPRVSYASIPATPAAVAMMTLVMLSDRSDPMNVTFGHDGTLSPADRDEDQRHRSRGEGCHRHPGRQAQEAASEQARASAGQAHARCDDRQQVGSHRHRANDQDGVPVEDSHRGDDPGHRHQGEVAGRGPTADARLGDEIRPDETVIWASCLLADRDRGMPDQRRIGGQPHRIELRQDHVGVNGIELGLDDDPGRHDQRNHCHVGETGRPREALDDRARRLRGHVDTELEHVITPVSTARHS